MKPEYDIAISFAGEDRTIAEQIAKALDEEGVNVFYDEYEQANLWGKDLYQYLTNTYSMNSEYCIILISEHYPNKNWTKLELKAAQERDFSQDKEYILPVRIDDTQVPGLRNTIGYLDLNRVGVDGVVEATLQKLGRKLKSNFSNDDTKNKDYSAFEKDFSDKKIVRSSNLTIKKKFSEKDVEEFMEEVYNFIKEYFYNSLKELKQNYDFIDYKFDKIDARHFAVKLFRYDEKVNECKIWFSFSDIFPYGINYSASIRQDDNGFNESLRPQNDGHIQYLKPLLLLHPSSNENDWLFEKDAAEYYWSYFIKPLQY